MMFPRAKRLAALFLFVLFATQSFAQNDGFAVTPIGSDLRDISASGTFVPLSDDVVSSAVAIGFSFNFYGNTYSEVYISSNGFLTFTSGQSSGCCSGQNLPSVSTPNNLVAGFWEDLNLSQGNIRYETLGVAPDREFVVGFYDNPHFFDGPPVTFEMILHESTSNIEFQYGDAPSDGGNHTVGAENADGTLATLVAYGDISFSQEGFLLESEFIESTPVPALRNTALVILVLLLGLAGFWYHRRIHPIN